MESAKAFIEKTPFMIDLMCEGKLCGTQISVDEDYSNKIE
jgi:hypothetical protein